MKALFACALCESTSAGTAVKRSRRRRDLCADCDADLLARGFDWCAMGHHKVRGADMAAGKGRCRACEAKRIARYATRNRADYARAWRAAHHDHALEYGRQYRQRNRARLNAARRNYYHRNPERARAYSREMYRKHLDKKRAWRKALYWRDPVAGRLAAKTAYIRRKLAILRGAA